MISISNPTTRQYLKVLLTAGLIFLIFASTVSAQNSQTLSVSPTLFDMSAEPGKKWSSSFRVINANPYELTVYASVVNFVPYGESGQGGFLSVKDSDSTGTTLAEWITIDTPKIVIPPEQTATVPFSITVPGDASPGGHFASIMVGTQPPDNDSLGSRVETSQVVTSLVFMRVAGEIIESGQIRSFRTTSRIVEQPQATIELRFENTGNVHLRPQGEIIITNMWGQSRGIIPVNQSTMFGNVLPESIRRYAFTWTGDWSLADIGRYKASVTLAYGDGSRQFVSSHYTFWLIPWKIVLTVMFGFAITIYVFVVGVRAYIRRVLLLSGVALDSDKKPDTGKKRQRVKKISVTAPLEAGMLDLREQMNDAETWPARLRATVKFIVSYRLFFVVCLLIIMSAWLIVWYANNASVEERNYQVTIDGPTGPSESLSSDEIQYRSLSGTMMDNEDAGEALSEVLPLRIINRSGVNGLGAKLRIRLESAGYEVGVLDTELGVSDINTVIVYAPELADTALTLSQAIPGALLSAYVDATEDEYPITVFVGQDLEDEL